MARHPVAAALVESDRLYFELGALVEPIHAATLVWIPGMEGAPGACVVQRIRADEVGGDPDAWISDVLGRLRRLGCSVARIYLDVADARLEAALGHHGFERRVEIGYLSPGPLSRGARHDVSLRRVLTEEDWKAKHDLHSSSVIGADGHFLSGPSWVELERAKCESGRLRAYLVEVDGAVCGAVASLEVDGLLRAKNVFVHPDHRRQGIGAAAMHRLSRRAVESGRRGTGIFGVDGKAGNALYRHVGMVPIAEQFEWSRRLR